MYAGALDRSAEGGGAAGFIARRVASWLFEGVEQPCTTLVFWKRPAADRTAGRFQNLARIPNLLVRS